MSIARESNRSEKNTHSHYPDHRSCDYDYAFSLDGINRFQNIGESTRVPPVIIPSNLEWKNFSEIFITLPFLKFYTNTIITTFFKTLGQLIFCSLAAFVLCPYRISG